MNFIRYSANRPWSILLLKFSRFKSGAAMSLKSAVFRFIAAPTSTLASAAANAFFKGNSP